MTYTNEDFVRLIEAVEEQHGEHVNDACQADELLYELPDGRRITQLTAGCEQPVLFDIAYDPAATVAVPEPMLEPDPNREEWTSLKGDPRVTMRSKVDEDGHAMVEIVTRGGRGGATPEKRFVRACAVEDNIGMWPRFQRAIIDARSK